MVVPGPETPDGLAAGQAPNVRCPSSPVAPAAVTATSTESLPGSCDAKLTKISGRPRVNARSRKTRRERAGRRIRPPGAAPGQITFVRLVRSDR